MKWYFAVVVITIGYLLLSDLVEKRIWRMWQRVLTKGTAPDPDLVAMGIQVVCATVGFLYVFLLHVTRALWFNLALAVLTGSPLIYGAVRSYQRYLRRRKDPASS